MSCTRAERRTGGWSGVGGQTAEVFIILSMAGEHAHIAP